MVKNLEKNQALSNMLTTRDVARIFNVHPATVRRWCGQGKIKSCRGPRGARLFKREDIAVAYLERNIRQYLKDI
jgi:excisionase family DNA binding protein